MMYKNITVTVQIPNDKYCNLCKYKGTFISVSGAKREKLPICKLGLGKPMQEGYNINKSEKCLKLMEE